MQLPGFEPVNRRREGQAVDAASCGSDYTPCRLLTLLPQQHACACVNVRACACVLSVVRGWFVFVWVLCSCVCGLFVMCVVCDVCV